MKEEVGDKTGGEDQNEADKKIFFLKNQPSVMMPPDF